jgi:hypothetical protein
LSRYPASKPIAKTLEVQALASQADPTLERKDGGNNNPYGRKGKPQDNHRSHDYGDSGESVKQDRGSEYLSQRIAEVSPDIHQAMLEGKYKSVRKAVVDAGVVKPQTSLKIL